MKILKVLEIEDWREYKRQKDRENLYEKLCLNIYDSIREGNDSITFNYDNEEDARYLERLFIEGGFTVVVKPIRQGSSTVAIGRDAAGPIIANYTLGFSINKIIISWPAITYGLDSDKYKKLQNEFENN